MSKRCVECKNLMLDGQEICPTCGFDQNYAYMIPQKKKRKFPVILAVIILLAVGLYSVYYLYDNGYINFSKKTTRPTTFELLTTTTTEEFDTSYMITAEQDFILHVDKYLEKTKEKYLIDAADKYNFDGYFVYELNTDIVIDSEYRLKGYILINANNRDMVTYTVFAYNGYFQLLNYEYLSTPTDNEYSNIPVSALKPYERKKTKNYVSKNFICQYYTDTYYPCYTDSN